MSTAEQKSTGNDSNYCSFESLIEIDFREDVAIWKEAFGIIQGFDLGMNKSALLQAIPIIFPVLKACIDSQGAPNAVNRIAIECVKHLDRLSLQIMKDRTVSFMSKAMIRIEFLELFGAFFIHSPWSGGQAHTQINLARLIFFRRM